MSHRQHSAPVGNPDRFPDGRPKSSPDDTSLLGLAAVWADLDAPVPPKKPHRNRHRKGSRHRARRVSSVSMPVAVGLGFAMVLALVVIVFLVTRLLGG